MRFISFLGLTAIPLLFSPMAHAQYSGASCSAAADEFEVCRLFPGEEVRSMRVRREFSDGVCERGITYGFFGSYLWVRDGCRAYFHTTHYADRDATNIYCGRPQPGDELRVCAAGKEIVTAAYRGEFDPNPACVVDETYGVHDGMLWVTGECGGNFWVELIPNEEILDELLFCFGKPGAISQCDVDHPVPRDIALELDLSGGACAEGDGWIASTELTPDGRRRYVEVENGCSGLFRVSATQLP